MAPKHSLSQEFIDDDDASDLEQDSNSGGSDSDKKPKKKAKKAAPKKKSPVKSKSKKAKKGSDEDEDDDEGSDDGGSSGLSTNKEGDKFLALGPAKRVTIRKYKGSLLIDIRETYSKDGVDGLPGKKGISLTHDQWNIMKSAMNQIDEAIDAC